MNTEVMFSSKTDLWATPQEFFDELNKEFAFTTDVCAIPENQSANGSSLLKWTDLNRSGTEYAGAILHMERKLASGSRKQVNLLALSSDFCQLVLIRNGSMNIF